MTTSPPIDTKKAPHRTLAFAKLDDLDAELSRIEDAHNAGVLETTGNWSAGQIFEHLGSFWKMTFDGFGFRAPLPLRLFARLIKKTALKKPPPRGFKLRGAIRVIEPQPEVAFEQGLTLLRAQIERVRTGDQMTHDSPLFGKFTHDQWLRLHLNHCSMHLGFTRYPDA